LWNEAKAQARITVEGEPHELVFGPDGNLT
jgi:hypothetical protein